VATPSYKITKAALNMLTVIYANELEKEGFTVFCVSPGVRLPVKAYNDSG
jgi:NAD(P)-dependent dehydrogenase (short-subunit alcohol dehydrogenase family)